MTFCDPLVFTYDHYGHLFPELDHLAAVKLEAIRARLLQVRMIQWSEKANQGWSPREDRKVSEARQ